MKVRRTNEKAPRVFEMAKPTNFTSFRWKEGDREAVEVGFDTLNVSAFSLPDLRPGSEPLARPTPALRALPLPEEGG